MEYLGVKKESNKEIFRLITPYFKEKIGDYSHQRITKDWHFHGLGFVKGEMTYVFGINIGFFRLEGPEHFSHLGMNILVRTNGVEEEHRLKFRDFFREHLLDWSEQVEISYESDRGGTGSQFPKYKAIDSFANQGEILQFLRDAIDFVHDKVYPAIWENPEGIFSGVDIASPPWEDTILELTDIKLGRNKYSARI
jgi:hypothetical protein